MAPFVQDVVADQIVSSGTLVLTLPGGMNCAVGNSIIVAVAGLSGSSMSLTTIADSKGNSWTIDLNTAGSTTALAICRSVLTVALVPGDTITIVCTGGTIARLVAAASEWTGLVGSTPDKTATAFAASGTSPASGSTATTAHANELLFGAVSENTTSTPSLASDFTVDVAFTALTPALTTGVGNNKGLFPSYRVVTATGTYSVSGTLGTSRAWRASLVTYQYSPITAHPRSFGVVIG